MEDIILGGGISSIINTIGLVLGKYIKRNGSKNQQQLGRLDGIFSTTDKVKALKTYHEIRSKHLEKLENPDKEVIIK